MKKIILPLAFLFLAFQIYGQSLALQVYDIFQNKCMSCHSNATQQNGLDLEGQGATVGAKALNVYNNIVGKTPSNSFAASEGYQYIYKGRPDLSFLFRKINEGLEETIDLHTSAGESMPPYGNEDLTDKEKELIRQWIILGAPPSDNLAGVHESYVQQIPQMIENFYDVNGLESFPDGAPSAPDPSEGFQIKMGPFYLNPAGQNFSELEFFQKYALDLPADVDVTRIDMKISNYSHHFIMYDYANPSSANGVAHGLRSYPDHTSIGLVAAVQAATDLNLPGGTAFIWDNDIVLDLNSHYINYSAANTYQAEVYINIYTQPAGIAAQEMHTDLVVKDDIWIPNNGNEYTFEESIVNNNGKVYIWGMMGHTHQWGTDYKVYLRNSNGTKGDLIYDASCSANGVPGCVSPFFDYQHIPMRYFSPLYELPLNPGFIHEASWINNGPTGVGYGPTSDDEMMVLVVMYTESIDGVITDVNDPQDFQYEVHVYPNPMQNKVTVVLPPDRSEVSFSLYNSMGQLMQVMENISEDSFTFSKGDLASGLYFYQVKDQGGRIGTGKIFIN